MNWPPLVKDQAGFELTEDDTPDPYSHLQALTPLHTGELGPRLTNTQLEIARLPERCSLKPKTEKCHLAPHVNLKWDTAQMLQCPTVGT